MYVDKKTRSRITVKDLRFRNGRYGGRIDRFIKLVIYTKTKGIRRYEEKWFRLLDFPPSLLEGGIYVYR